MNRLDTAQSTLPLSRRPSHNSSPRWLAIGAALGAGLVFKQILGRLRETSLQSQIVLITGGTRGLGYRLALEFAQHGCRIAVCGRDSEEIERVQRDLTAQNIDALALVCDVSDQVQVKQMIQDVTEYFGRIDILVNNAGTIQIGPLVTLDVKDFHDAIDVIFYGHVNCTMAVLPQMRERGNGRIVNITSIGGKVSVPHLLPYSAAKFAAIGFSEGLRAELVNEGITVTTIIPGLMRTGSYLNAMIKGRAEEEFTWFSLGDNLPISSMDAGWAAHQIVQATRRGESERILTLPAVILDGFHRLFPNLTVEVMGLVNRFLPSAEGGTTEPTWSMDVDRKIDNPALDALLKPGRVAAEVNHELPGPIDTLIEKLSETS